MVLAEAVVRLLPGALGSPESLAEESHQDGLLEYPHYTRPPDFRGWTVPDILRSGDHARIEAWRRQQRLDSDRAPSAGLAGREGVVRPNAAIRRQSGAHCSLIRSRGLVDS